MDSKHEKPIILDYPTPRVARLTLNRPKANNALSLELQALLSSHFTELNKRPDIGCILLTGGNSVFSAGGDIQGLADVSPVNIYQRHTEQVWAPIKNCIKPIIAAVSGYAYGGGCELAMHADIIIAGKSASFCQPEIKIGIMPGIGGTQRLVRAIGKTKAMYMALTGSPISAYEAWISGLVSEIIEDDQIQKHSVLLADKIARMPPLAAEQIKEVIIAGMDASLETGLALERKASALLFASQDQKEGMKAFLEKRAPIFEGK